MTISGDVSVELEELDFFLSVSISAASALEAAASVFVDL